MRDYRDARTLERLAQGPRDRHQQAAAEKATSEACMLIVFIGHLARQRDAIEAAA